MRLGERVLALLRGIYDDGTMDSGSIPLAVSMPPKGAFLCREDDLLGKLGSWLNRALRDIIRSVRPWIPWLRNAMPARD